MSVDGEIGIEEKRVAREPRLRGQKMFGRRSREWRPGWTHIAALSLRALGTPMAFTAVLTLAAAVAAHMLYPQYAPRWASAAVVATGLLAMGVIWATRARARVVRSVSRLSSQLGVGAFGGAPDPTEQALRQLPPDRRTPHALVMERPEAPLSVALRGIYERLDRALGAGQVVMVSPVKKAGAHGSFALMLAATAAAAGRRALVVDCDLHQRGATKQLGFDEALGLWDVVQGRVSWRQAVTPIEELGADFLPAGAMDRPVRELYTEGRLPTLLAELRAHYDVLIVDAPAALQGPDARMTAALADVAVLVASWGKTPILEARRAINALCDRAPHVRVGVAVLGARARGGTAPV